MKKNIIKARVSTATFLLIAAFIAVGIYGCGNTVAVPIESETTEASVSVETEVSAEVETEKELSVEENIPTDADDEADAATGAEPETGEDSVSEADAETASITEAAPAEPLPGYTNYVFSNYQISVNAPEDIVLADGLPDDELYIHKFLSCTVQFIPKKFSEYPNITSTEALLDFVSNDYYSLYNDFHSISDKTNPVNNDEIEIWTQDFTGTTGSGQVDVLRIYATYLKLKDVSVCVYAALSPDAVDTYSDEFNTMVENMR